MPFDRRDSLTFMWCAKQRLSFTFTIKPILYQYFKNFNILQKKANQIKGDKI